MKIIGIIAEYNPFHNGHLYHLQEAKKRTSAQGVICVLSGNFLQRGEPAFVNKWARTKMALQHGVDLVFELPVLYATHSAYWFARGGIETLAQTGIATHLAFGVETADLALFQEIATFLATEPPSYQGRLKQLLRTGLSFPQARIQALPPELSCYAELLQSPNNILALTYLQILREQKLTLKPAMIERQGLGYLDTSLKKDTFPSATAIRNHLTQNIPQFLTALQELRRYLPQTTLNIIQDEYQQGQTPIFFDQLTPQLMTLLRRTTKKELQQIIDISEGLENRITKIALQTTNLQEFLTRLKTKRYTSTRLQRFLLHLLLNYTKEHESFLPKGPPYLHLLGFTPYGQELLQEIKKKSPLPFITKGAHIHKYLHHNSTAHSFWEMDTRATNLYTLLYPNPVTRKGNLDYFKKPIF